MQVKQIFSYFYQCKLPLLLGILCAYACANQQKPVKEPQKVVGEAARISFRNNTFDTYRVKLSEVSIQFFLEDSSQQKIGSLGHLRDLIAQQGDKLLMGTNAGMYQRDQTPLGLYIENGTMLRPLVTRNAKGNFYLKPNGVFLLSHNKAAILKTENYAQFTDSILFATQSGPLLLYNDSIHSAFTEGSANVHIRNGVGIINDHEIVFAISNERVNFYDFASLFKEKFGCKDALYLDGFVSKMYLPELDRLETTGNFGPMIGILKKK